MNRTSHLNNDAMQDDAQLILARMKAAMALKFAKKKETDSAIKTELTDVKTETNPSQGVSPVKLAALQ